MGIFDWMRRQGRPDIGEGDRAPDIVDDSPENKPRQIVGFYPMGDFGLEGQHNGYFDGSKYPTGFDSGTLYGGVARTLDYHTLRERSEHMVRTNAIASNIIETMKDAVIGPGMKLEATPKYDIIEAAGFKTDRHAWTRETEMRFDLWAQGAASGYARRYNFYRAQALAYKQYLVQGKVIAIIRKMAPTDKQVRRGMISNITVQILPADRLATDSRTGLQRGKYNIVGGDKNHTVIDGTAMDERGQAIGYYIYDRDHNDEILNRALRVKYVPRWSRDGREQVVVLTRHHSPIDVAGEPFLTAVLQDLKDLEEYRSYELVAARVNATYAMEVRNPNLPTGRPNVSGKKQRVKYQNEDGTTTEEVAIRPQVPGIITVHGKPGEELHSHDTKRPNVNFPTFSEAIIKQIAASRGIPIEILHKAFNSNYSASRAALIEYWRKVTTDRGDFASGFLNRIYESWLAAEYEAGRIVLPGAEANPIVKQAWCSARWHGAARGVIDPMKEVKAAIEAENAGYQSAEQAARNLYNSDYYTNIDHLAVEKGEREKAGIERKEEIPPPRPGAHDRRDRRGYNERGGRRRR